MNNALNIQRQDYENRIATLSQQFSAESEATRTQIATLKEQYETAIATAKSSLEEQMATLRATLSAEDQNILNQVSALVRL